MKKKQIELKKPTYISLFSSAGVGCFGFKKAGFDCIATNELIERRLNIQKINKKCKYPSGYISGDITLSETKVRIYTEIEMWRSKENKDVEVVIASPPCQGMSVANHKKADDEIVRNSLVVESIIITKKINPKFFIFENVQAFLKTPCVDTDGVQKSILDAINHNLAGTYNIESKVINFKSYGSNSSRTRTLVIGVRKDLHNITPYDLFPSKEKEKTLKDVIGKMPALKKMGSFDSKDFYHNFRSYPEYMYPWVKDLKEGESAFDNKDPNKRPYKMENGKKIFNQNKNGDKYKKGIWDKVGPCVHTRNDQLASQNTMHPRDPRVFSIRELMKMMTIPDDFRWIDMSLEDLNNLSIEEKQSLLKKNENNIRQSLGEAIPTVILQKIGENIKTLSNLESDKTLISIIKQHELSETTKLIKFIKNNELNLHINDLARIAELANNERTQTGAYYTRTDISFNLIKQLPEVKTKSKTLKILEPSVGVGNFFRVLLSKYIDNEVEYDLADIDSKSIEILKALISKMNVPKNIKINYHVRDFLSQEDKLTKYFLVAGNPPFGKLISPEGLSKFRTEYKDLAKKVNDNIFSLFVAKTIVMAPEYIAFISPKVLISAPNFNETKSFLTENRTISHISDYGEEAFSGVKIETIGFISPKKNDERNKMTVESYIKNTFESKDYNYVINKLSPIWLLYRNEKFDKVFQNLTTDVFTCFRDRQISKKDIKEKGDVTLIKARDISEDLGLVAPPKTFVEQDKKKVFDFLNSKSVIVPNFTYNTRAMNLPKKSIVDGSCAILIPKNKIKYSKKDLKFFASPEFREFYKIVCNYSVRTLNVDKNTVIFWGLLKQ